MKKNLLFLLFFCSCFAWSQPGGSGGTTILGQGGGAGITASPNPATQNLTITTVSNSASITGYTFMNSNQQTVINQSVQSTSSVTVDISALPKGTYTLYVYLNNDKYNPEVKQIVKE